LFACGRNTSVVNERALPSDRKSVKTVSLVVLGTVQDGGSPHAGCIKNCCKDLFMKEESSRKITSLGLIDPAQPASWIFEASPDFGSQLRELNSLGSRSNSVCPDGIFLTHAHIGHYTGLMLLGREAMAAKEARVYAMPRMRVFLETNGPWSQLVSLHNIFIESIQAEHEISLGDRVRVRPFLVPHRDEFSETVGFLISGPSKKVLFIPDIDKWSKWEKNIVDEIKNVDHAFIDGTFYSGQEINNRDISEIPHPFVIESMELFKNMSASEKNKICFIHFNHTNPLLDPNSNETKQVLGKGFRIAKRGDVFEL